MDQPPDPDTDTTTAKTSVSASASDKPDRPFALILAGVLVGVLLTAFAVAGALGWHVPRWPGWSWEYWTGDKKPNIIEALRNLGLLLIAAPALWLAWKRTSTASKQAAISERGLQIDRYQKGALMLASDELPVRIAGIFALRELALSDPKPSYILVLDVLYAFVREKSKARLSLDFNGGETREEYAEFEADLSEALKAATHLRNTAEGAGSLETENDWKPNLRSVILYSTQLQDANLSGAHLQEAILRSADLLGANLSCADLQHADLSGANLRDTDLSGADLLGAKLPGANLSGTNFKNAKLDLVAKLAGIWAFEDDPPRNMPDHVKAAIVYRERGEVWDDFIALI